MNVDQQIQVLIDQAPHYGVTSAEVQIIAPALKAIAEQLKHPAYYILQTPEQGWIMTTLTHSTQKDKTRNVVYAFPTLRDVQAASRAQDAPNVVALPIPAAHILFQMLAMKPVDSIVFFETPGDLRVGTEINRDIFMQLMHVHLQKSQSKSSIPPDIA